MKTFFEGLVQLCIAFDQVLNTVLGLLTGRVGYADETLSAHAWRSYRDGKVWGRILMPPIDWMFSWQKPDPTIVDATGEVAQTHCLRAHLKEVLRRNLPPEYRA